MIIRFLRKGRRIAWSPEMPVYHPTKNEAGLDHYQVRSWRAWYAHITLSMLALAWLAASKAQAVKGEPAPATQA